MRHIITTQYSQEDFKIIVDTAVKEALQQLLPIVIQSTKSPPHSEKLLTRKEVCKILQISTPTLSKLQKSGELKAIIVGGSYRFSERNIQALLNKK